jgi:hypothetical protein
VAAGRTLVREGQHCQFANTWFGPVAAVGLSECEARQLPLRNEPVDNSCAAVGPSRRLGAPGDAAPRVAVAAFDTSARSETQAFWL